MPFVQSNLNPYHRRVGDCVARAISAALDQDWDTTYLGLCAKGFDMKDFPDANAVWGAYLRDHGFTRHIAPEDHIDGIYTVADFSRDFPHGTYILAIDGHVVCVKNGQILDSWNSSEEIPIFYWSKKEDV